MFTRANTADPEENISDTLSWRGLPGMNGKYQFALRKSTTKVYKINVTSTNSQDKNGNTQYWVSFYLKQDLGL